VAKLAGKTRDPRRRVEQSEFVEAALRIVEREGLEALSFRRLAAEFDVSAMSVFRIVRDKEQLLDLLTEAMFRQVQLPPPGGKWTERISAIARSAAAALGRYPELAVRALRGPHMYSTATGARIVNEVLESLLEAGFKPKSAALAFTMTRYIHLLGLPSARRKEDADGQPLYMPVYLPPEDSALLRVAPFSATLQSEDHFEFALEIMILGFEQYLKLQDHIG